MSEVETGQDTDATQVQDAPEAAEGTQAPEATTDATPSEIWRQGAGKGYDDVAASSKAERLAAAEEAAKAEAAKAGKKPEGEAKPEEKPAVEPEAKPEEAPPAEGALTPEQMAQQQQELTQNITAYNQAVTDPAFKAIFAARQDPTFQKMWQAYLQGKTGDGPGQPGTEDPQTDGKPQTTPEQKPAFESETPNELRLYTDIQAMGLKLQSLEEANETLRTELTERHGKVDETLDRYGADLDSRLMMNSQAVVDTAFDEVKKEYPDLVDGGKNEKALVAKTAKIIKAASVAKDPITVQEALTEAAIVLGHATNMERANKAQQKRAQVAAGALVEPPGSGQTPPPTVGSRAEIGAAWEEAQD